MEIVKSLFKKQRIGELLLACLFVIYLILGYNTPQYIASVADTIIGKIIIISVVIYMFLKSHPILAILGLFVAFDLIRRSSIITGNSSLENYSLSDAKKSAQMAAFNNDNIYTLEQEMVKKMTPIINMSNLISESPATYNPVSGNTYSAAQNDTGDE